MTISYVGTLTVNSTWVDGFINPVDSLLYAVESSTNTFRKFNLDSVTQTSSVGTLSGPSGICFINASSAVIPSSANGTVDFIELTTNYRQNVTGSGISTSKAKTQSVASDPSLGVAFAVNNSNSTLTKITASPQAITNLNVPAWLNHSFSFRPLCIIFKSSGRWLVGGTQGRVFEIDSSGNLIDEFQMGATPNSGAWSSSAEVAALGEGSPPSVIFMSYTDNMLLLAMSDGALWLVDYTTKTRIWEGYAAGSAGSYFNLICQGSSGETLATSFNQSSSTFAVQELDCTVEPVQVVSNIFSNSNVGTNGFLAMNPSGNQGVFLGTYGAANKLLSFTVTPRSTTTRTITVQNGGVHQQARLVILDDTGGVGTAAKVLDTYMQSPATYRVPTGKNLIEIVKVNEGTTALWDVSRYST